MRKTITITDPMQVEPDDKAFFKDCDFGFTVFKVNRGDTVRPFMIYNPLIGDKFWALSSRFDHATREVEGPEWPKPSDRELHIYLGSDGEKYLYMPEYDCDCEPWRRLPSHPWRDADGMTSSYPAALPLKELKLVPAKDDDNEQ